MHAMLRGLPALVLAFSIAACSRDSGPTVVKPVNQALIVNGAQGIAAMVDAGYYGSVNENITSVNFSALATRRTETIALMAFNRSISSAHAVEEMRARGYRPARLDECLAYGAALTTRRDPDDVDLPSYPHYSVVCLGQSVLIDGLHKVPEIWSEVWNNHRNWQLRLAQIDGGWNYDDRFLVVHT